MADKYCSVRFKTGEELDQALAAALSSCDDAERAEKAANLAESAAGRAEVVMSETEDIFVKNRTHWEEVISEGGIVFPSTDIEFKTSIGALSGVSKDQIVAGRKYIVTWNGTAYECTAFLLYESSADSVALGNASLLNEGEDTGEPFVLADFISSGCAVTKTDSTAETITIQIDAVREVVVYQLDPKYLPNGVPYIEGGMVEILPETAVDPTNDIHPYKLGLVAGSTYAVVINGEEYECVGQEYTEGGVTAVVLGDLYTMSGGQLGTAATGEPFVILEYPPELAASEGLEGAFMFAPFGFDDSVTSFTLSVCGDDVTAHKLDNRCLDLDWLPVMNETLIEEINTADGQTRTSEKVNYKVLPVGTELVVYVDGERCECTVTGDGGPDDGYYFFCVNEAGTIVANIMLTQSGYVAKTNEGDHTVAFYTEEPNKLPNEFLDLAWLPEYEYNYILPEQTFTASEQSDGSISGYISLEEDINSTLSNGENVVVILDGVPYEVTLNVDLDCTTAQLGNGAFLYISYKTAGVFYTTAGSHTIAIADANGLVPKEKLPAKFLPDDIGGIYNVYFTVDSDGNATTEQAYEEAFAKANDANVMVRAIVTKDSAVFHAPLSAWESADGNSYMIFSCVYYFSATKARSIMWVSDGTITCLEL